MTANHVLVGVDGSPGAAAALDWAADEAHYRQIGLLITHVSDNPDPLGLSPTTADLVEQELAERAQKVLAEALRVARIRRPGIEISTSSRPRNPVRTLIELSGDAELLVLGRQGMHSRFDAMLGGVSHQVAAYAWCPVTVVPLPVHTTEPGTVPTIVVGVTYRIEAVGVLDAAFRQAYRRGARVQAIRAVAEPALEPASQKELDECIDRIASQYPTVDVDAKVLHGQSAQVLLDAAQGADLLVVGVRHLGDRRISRLSWPATVLLAQAQCPVELVGWPV